MEDSLCYFSSQAYKILVLHAVALFICPPFLESDIFKCQLLKHVLYRKLLQAVFNGGENIFRSKVFLKKNYGYELERNRQIHLMKEGLRVAAVGLL